MLATYDAHSHNELFQGKLSATKHSGMKKSVDTITAPPHKHWPNEGYQGTGGKKRQFYDELSMLEWIVGQLANVYHIADPTLSKQALLQVIYAMKDTTSLPWVAVINAWASSMHCVEENTLSWGILHSGLLTGPVPLKLLYPVPRQ